MQWEQNPAKDNPHLVRPTPHSGRVHMTYVENSGIKLDNILRAQLQVRIRAPRFVSNPFIPPHSIQHKDPNITRSSRHPVTRCSAQINPTPPQQAPTPDSYPDSAAVIDPRQLTSQSTLPATRAILLLVPVQVQVNPVLPRKKRRALGRDQLP